MPGWYHITGVSHDDSLYLIAAFGLLHLRPDPPAQQLMHLFTPYESLNLCLVHVFAVCPTPASLFKSWFLRLKVSNTKREFIPIAIVIDRQLVSGVLTLDNSTCLLSRNRLVQVLDSRTPRIIAWDIDPKPVLCFGKAKSRQTSATFRDKPVGFGYGESALSPCG